MTAEEALDLLDESAIRMCRAFQTRDEICAVVRTKGPEDLSIICLGLPPKLIATMLRNAADIYEQNAEAATFN